LSAPFGTYGWHGILGNVGDLAKAAIANIEPCSHYGCIDGARWTHLRWHGRSVKQGAGRDGGWCHGGRGWGRYTATFIHLSRGNAGQAEQSKVEEEEHHGRDELLGTHKEKDARQWLIARGQRGGAEVMIWSSSKGRSKG
jgi:hypothetical protein